MAPPVPPPPDPALAAHVDTADATLAALGARAPAGALLRVSASDADPPGELAWFPIDPIHPLDLLLGFVAPAHWWALGVSSRGRQHPIDGARPRDPQCGLAAGAHHRADRPIRRGGRAAPPG